MSKLASTILRVAICSAIVLGLAGCGCGKGSDDGLNKEQSKSADRMDTIIKKSEGNFDKLEPADRDWLVNSMAAGNEQAARMMFNARTGKPPSGGPGSAAPRGGPGGAPGGIPGGPPGAQPGPGGSRPIGGPGGGPPR